MSCFVVLPVSAHSVCRKFVEKFGFGIEGPRVDEANGTWNVPATFGLILADGTWNVPATFVNGKI